MGQAKNLLTKGFVGGLPRKVYKTLLARISAGDNVCLLQYAEHYRSTAHMLDEYGIVRPEYRNKYGPLLYSAKSKQQSELDGPLKAVLFKRLQNHLKKNRTRRGVAVPFCKTENTGLDRKCYLQFGFTLDELIAYVEVKFVSGMSWERVVSGEIQLDHEIPVRVFDLTTIAGIHAAYSLSNTNPMWRGDNARKGVTTDKDWIELFGEGVISGC